jgi:hypothetical protein
MIHVKQIYQFHFIFAGETETRAALLPFVAAIMSERQIRTVREPLARRSEQALYGQTIGECPISQRFFARCGRELSHPTAAKEESGPWLEPKALLGSLTSIAKLN